MDPLASDVKRSDKTFVQLAETYLKQTEQPFEEKLLASFGLVSPDGFLANVGLLFADDCPIYQSRVVCTRWSDLHKDDAINDAEFQGNIIRLLKNSQDFIKANTAKRWYKLPTYRLNFPMESNSKKPTESASNKFFAIGYCGSKIKHYLCCTNVVQNGRGLYEQRKRRFCKMLKAKHLRSLR